jgi:hypothetical protein
LNDSSIDPQTRAIIRYGLETNDPWLAQLVRCVDAGEAITDDNIAEAETAQSSHDDESEEKIETLGRPAGAYVNNRKCRASEVCCEYGEACCLCSLW